MVDIRIDEFGDDRGDDRAENDPELERKDGLPPCAFFRAVDYPEEELPGSLPSGLGPAGLCGQEDHELKIERGTEIYRCSQPYSGDSSLFSELLVDQIPPGEGEGIDEARVHHERAKIGNLGRRYIAGKGEEQVEPAEDYDGLGLV